MWPFSTRVKRSFISFDGAADGDRARDVGGAVEILAAAIDQEERAAREAAVGLRRDAIVDDGAVRAGAGDGVEGEILQRAGVSAEALQLLARFDLLHLAALALGREPMQEARNRRAVARVRLARAFDFRRVLARARQHDRVLPAHDLQRRPCSVLRNTKRTPSPDRACTFLPRKLAQRRLQFVARLAPRLRCRAIGCSSGETFSSAKNKSAVPS